MSETGYIAANGKDLIYIFQPKQTGTNQTTYYSTGGVDLSNIFQPWDGSSPQAQITGFSVNGIDLCTIFQNSVNNVNSNYNPFSASTTPTGYIYNIFNNSSPYTITSDLSNVYILLVGGGGGGGSGFGFNGGGAGGIVTTYGQTNLNSGTYSIQIGLGGIGGPVNPDVYIYPNAGNGTQGGTTTFSGPGISLSASGGGGGGGSQYALPPYYGAGGTNGSSPAYGTGGAANVNQGNIQNGYNPQYGGDAQDGFNYTFQDGTGTSFLFGGGGGAGGRNEESGPIPNTYYGGGGFVGTRNGITFTQFTGGCGGLGSYGISFFPGFDFSFNYQYNVGSGGGAGGNSDANYAISGGTGNDGIAIIYYPAYIVSGTYTISSNSNYNRIITFTGNGTIQFNANVGPVVCVLVGGGAGGENSTPPIFGSSGGNGGNGGGGGQVIQQNLTYQTGQIYNISIGSGGTGAYFNGITFNAATNGNLTSISPSILTDPSLNALGGLTNGGGGGGGAVNGDGGNGGSAVNGGSVGGYGSSGGGDGEAGHSSANNSGGGGGGGGGAGFLAYTDGSNGGNGGSGIVIMSFNV